MHCTRGLSDGDNFITFYHNMQNCFTTATTCRKIGPREPVPFYGSITQIGFLHLHNSGRNWFRGPIKSRPFPFFTRIGLIPSPGQKK